MAKKLTEADILEAYRAAQGMGRTEFAHALGMSKQSYSAYMRGAKQDLDGLQWSAVEYRGTWIGELAVDLLKVREAVVPCVCLEFIWDNGVCPKHPLSPPSALSGIHHSLRSGAVSPKKGKSIPVLGEKERVMA